MFRWIIIGLVCLNCWNTIVGQQLNFIELESLIEEKLPAIMKEHRAFVSLPNDAHFLEDMEKNAAWLEQAFTQRGFNTLLIANSSVPVVFAEKRLSPDKPTVLFYFHYDGQPVDPSQWDQEDPFVPVLKKQDPEKGWQEIPYKLTENSFDPEWRIFARAAADDKGPIMMFLAAMDIMKEQQIEPAFNIKVMLDGEEEIGSAGLLETLEANRQTYAADHLIIMDGPAHPTNRPTLTFGCRGVATAALTVYGPIVPQHSGHFGNYAPNPVFRLARLLASMKDDDGRVIIPGFYDGIQLDEKTQQILAGVPDDELAIKNRLGIAEAEKVGANYQESLQFPSLNARGIAAAWIGRQTRTIVPDKAVVQLGIRLVPESDGDRLLDLVREHIKAQGYYLLDREPTTEERQTHAKIATFVGRKAVNAFRTPLESLTGEWLTQAIQKVHGQEPVRIRTMGGTVPVTPLIEALNMPAVIVPMVNMDNNQHSPNENLRLGNFYDGIKSCYGILTEPLSF